MFIAVGSTSCTKDYTCECDGSNANLDDKTYTINSKTEEDAKEVCEGYADGTGGLVVCELK